MVNWSRQCLKDKHGGDTHHFLLIIYMLLPPHFGYSIARPFCHVERKIQFYPLWRELYYASVKLSGERWSKKLKGKSNQWLSLRYLIQENPFHNFGTYSPERVICKKQESISDCHQLFYRGCKPHNSLAIFQIFTPTCAHTHIQDDLFRFPLANSEGSLAAKQPHQWLLWSWVTNSTPWNQTHVIRDNKQNQKLMGGKCTFGRKCVKSITMTFSILGHMIYSVVFMFPNYNLCLSIRLQKLPLELSVLIKYQLLFFTVIYTH